MKRVDLSEEYIKSILEMLTENGISYSDEFCDRKHAYVLHCWINEENKCNLFLRTLRWVPFGYHKGISGQGIDELKRFLSSVDNFNKKEYSYKEKYEALKEVLISVRNEYNFDIIDEALEEYK